VSAVSERSAEQLRRGLVRDLRAKGLIRSDDVEAAFLAVPRERFVAGIMRERGLEAAYRDEALVTRRDARGMPLSSSSQPALMAEMLELLAARAGDRVLEIGAGTGYNAALLAQIVGSKGRVTSVEIDRQLATRARAALRDARVRVSVVVGDGRDGHVRAAPYDRIIVTACADEIPRTWFEQLSCGGRLVLPLRLDPDGAAIQLIPVLEHQGDRLRSVGLTWGGFMPLHGGDGGWHPPSAMLAASHSRSGRDTSLISVSGGALNGLSEDAARALLASMLAEPRTALAQGVTDLDSGRPPLLLIYLMLNIPVNKRVSLRSHRRLGIGLIDRGGRSWAAVSVRSPWMSAVSARVPRARWRLDADGHGTAAMELLQLLAQWRELQRAGRATVQVTARPYRDALRVSFAW
jgi:protein-L-isoaspartate(D-aspartate) O-methyltransferase